MANYTLLQERFKHQSNAKLDFFTRELFTGLNLCCADSQGRLLDIPGLIAGQIFPWEESVTPAMISKALVQLARAKWIIRYEVRGVRYIQVNSWWEGNSQPFASPSNYPPPEYWLDRIRCQTKDGYATQNWNGHKDEHPTIGKFIHTPTSPPRKPTLPAHPTSPPCQDSPAGPHEPEPEIEIEPEDEKKPEIVDDPSNLSTRGQDAAPRVGGLEPAIIKLTRPQKESARTCYKIFGASGLGNPKLINISVDVAMRISLKDLRGEILAALASAYNDEGAKNKPAIAAYRLQNNKTPPEYRSPSTWKVIPANVLVAAGISNLASYCTKEFLRE